MDEFNSEFFREEIRNEIIEMVKQKVAEMNAINEAHSLVYIRMITEMQQSFIDQILDAINEFSNYYNEQARTVETIPTDTHRQLMLEFLSRSKERHFELIHKLVQQFSDKMNMISKSR